MAGEGIWGFIQDADFPSDKRKDELYGTKPIVPELDFFGSYNQTIADNMGLLPGAQKLAGQTNQANLANLTSLFESLDPKYQDTLLTIGETLNRRAKGDIGDLGEKVARSSAAKQVGAGVAGSPFARDWTARDLGLTTYDVERTATGDMAQWLSHLRKDAMPVPADVRENQINPAKRMEDDFNRDWLSAQVTASPDPGERGAFDTKMGLAGMILSIYGGGAGYTNSYKPNYGGNSNTGTGSGGNYWGDSGEMGMQQDYQDWNYGQSNYFDDYGPQLQYS